MPPDQHNESPEEKFLLTEYQGLIQIDGSRNEPLDRFLTMFVTLAAAPWALYVLILKDNPNASLFARMPSPVAVAFMLIGVLGSLVAMMFVQMRLTIILYTRSMNAIRGYFVGTETTRLSFRLPTDPTKPHYYEKGSYIQIAVAGMALVNSGYIGFGVYSLVSSQVCSPPRIWAGALVTLMGFIAHMAYYVYQARKREKTSRGERELQWQASGKGRA